MTLYDTQTMKVEKRSSQWAEVCNIGVTKYWKPFVKINPQSLRSWQ